MMEHSYPEKNNKNKKSSFSVITLLLMLFVLLYLIVNITSVKVILNKIGAILSPLIIGCAISYLVNPIMKIFEENLFKKIRRHGLRRAISLILSYLFFLVIIALFLFLVAPEVSKSVSELFSHFDSYVNNAVNSINNTINRIATLLGLSNPQETYLKFDEIVTALTKMMSGTGNILETIYTYISTYGKSFVTGFTNILIGVFISVYILSSKEKRYAQTNKIMHAIFSDAKCDYFFNAAGLANKSFLGFIAGKIIDSMIIGVLTFIVLTIFKMPYTALISVIVGVTNVIPYFGPIIGAVPSAFIILIAEPSKTIPFIIMILAIQQLDGNVIGPRILGDNTGLSALGIILSISIMSGLFGVIGMLIGVPICAIIVALIQQRIDFRLKKKHKSTNLDDYYTDSIKPPEDFVPLQEQINDEAVEAQSDAIISTSDSPTVPSIINDNNS